MHHKMELTKLKQWKFEKFQFFRLFRIIFYICCLIISASGNRTNLLYAGETGHHAAKAGQKTEAVEKAANIHPVQINKDKKNENGYCFYGDYGIKGFKEGELYNPSDISIGPKGFIYVVDTFNHQIKKYRIKLELDSVIGSQGKNPGKFYKPSSIALDSDGNIYVADMLNNRIQVFDSNQKLVRVWGVYGRGKGQLANPLAVAVDSNNHVYVADMNHRITIFDKKGEFISIWGKGGTRKGEFSFPSALCIDEETGILYVGDHNNNRIQMLNQGVTIKIFKEIKGLPGKTFSPSGVTINGQNLFISDSANHRLIVLNKMTGRLINWYGKEGRGPGEFSEPRGIAFIKDNFLLVVDRYNSRIQIFKKPCMEE